MLKLFCARDEEEDICKGFGRVRVTTEHHVCETNVVVCLVVAGRNANKHRLHEQYVSKKYLLVEFDVIHHFER